MCLVVGRCLGVGEEVGLLWGRRGWGWGWKGEGRVRKRQGGMPGE